MRTGHVDEHIVFVFALVFLLMMFMFMFMFYISRVVLAITTRFVLSSFYRCFVLFCALPLPRRLFVTFPFFPNNVVSHHIIAVATTTHFDTDTGTEHGHDLDTTLCR